MTRYAAFLRGVNLGKRTVKSAELKSAFEAMGFTEVKTLLASGNVLFDARASKGLQLKIENGLAEQFGFSVGTVLRPLDELKATVEADPFKGLTEDHGKKLYVLMFAKDLPAGFSIKSVPGDYVFPRIDAQDIYMIVYRKPDGAYSAGLLGIEKALPKGMLVTTRNWNTILKAVA